MNEKHKHILEDGTKGGCCGSGKGQGHGESHGHSGCCGSEGEHDHSHSHSGCCGSGHHHGHEHGEDDHEHDHAKIYLETEDGEELECDVLGIFEFEGQEYIAIIPVDDETAYLYRYSEVDEEPALNQIESDEEYARVSDYFMELVEDEEE